MICSPILSYGMGVESTAILARWIFDPETRVMPSGERFELKDLTVVTSQVGSEYADTKELVETYILPLLREHGIRFVQLAKRGPRREGNLPNYIVLDDSRCPERLFFEGHYTLREHMLSNGTVPTYSAIHRCSLNFKAEVIEAWMGDTFYQPAIHAFGYNASEQKRVAGSEAGILDRNLKNWKQLKKNPDIFNLPTEEIKRVFCAFGFNSQETRRAADGSAYDFPLRIGWYPLLDWDFDREKCHECLTATFGVRWTKSCCAFCPFAKLKGAAAERYAKYPETAADDLLMEFVSMSLNPRGQLFKSKSLYQTCQDNRSTAAIALFEQKRDELPLAIYQVRRLFRASDKLDKDGNPKKGNVLRSLKIPFTGTKAEVAARFKTMIGELGLTVETANGIDYGWIKRKTPGYPTAEEMYVMAPATAREKQLKSFEQGWDEHATGGMPLFAGLYCGADDFVAQACDEDVA